MHDDCSDVATRSDDISDVKRSTNECDFKCVTTCDLCMSVEVLRHQLKASQQLIMTALMSLTASDDISDDNERNFEHKMVTRCNVVTTEEELSEGAGTKYRRQKLPKILTT